MLRNSTTHGDVTHHSDRDVQYRAIRYTERLAEAGAVASVGSRGDSYDNALAEAFNSLFKAELVRHRGPWKSIDDLEFAVAEYIDWFNNRRLHSAIGMIPPPLRPSRATTIHTTRPSRTANGSQRASDEPGAQHLQGHNVRRARPKGRALRTLNLGSRENPSWAHAAQSAATACRRRGGTVGIESLQGHWYSGRLFRSSHREPTFKRPSAGHIRGVACLYLVGADEKRFRKTQSDGESVFTRLATRARVQDL